MQLFGGERPQTWKYALICKGKEERIVEVGVTWKRWVLDCWSTTGGVCATESLEDMLASNTAFK